MPIMYGGREDGEPTLFWRVIGVLVLTLGLLAGNRIAASQIVTQPG